MNVGELDLALCTPLHAHGEGGDDWDDRLFLMMVRKERPSSPPQHEWPCSLALDLLQGCERLGMFSLSDVSSEALHELSRLPDALQVNCLGYVAADPRPGRHVVHAIEVSVAHAVKTHWDNPPRWLTLPARRNLGPGRSASTLLDRCRCHSLLADFRGHPGLEPLWDLEHVSQVHAVSVRSWPAQGMPRADPCVRAVGAGADRGGLHGGVGDHA